MPALPPNVTSTAGPEPGVPAIVITDRVTACRAGRRVIYRPPSLVLGAGASRGVTAAEMGDLMDRALADAGLSAASVRQVATVDLKEDEQGLLAAARERGWEVTGFAPAELAAVAVPNPSEAVRAAIGTPSVAEAAALLAAGPGAVLAAPKRKSPRATVAIAQARGRAAGSRSSGSAPAHAT